MKRFYTLFFFYFMGLMTINAHPGVGIVMNSEGSVFYTDLTHVWKISASGEHSIAVRNVHTHELYMDEEDNLYGEHEWYNGEATDTWGNYVWCLSSDGVFQKTVDDVEGFLDNNTLVRDLENSTYWVEKSGDYEMLKKQTESGENDFFTQHRFNDIRWKYFSKHDGNLYVVDHLKIKKITSLGKVSVIADDLKEAGGPFGGVADRHYIYGIWTKEGEGLYVAVYGASKVKKIGINGEITVVFESQKGWSPCGGMIASDGTQWIMEFSERNETRITKISTTRKHTIYGG